MNEYTCIQQYGCMFLLLCSWSHFTNSHLVNIFVIQCPRHQSFSNIIFQEEKYELGNGLLLLNLLTRKLICVDLLMKPLQNKIIHFYWKVFNEKNSDYLAWVWVHVVGSASIFLKTAIQLVSELCQTQFLEFSERESFWSSLNFKTLSK